MKVQLLKVPASYAYSFSVRKDRFPNINNQWHHHMEVELIHFHEGAGLQFIGDHISRFEAGDIVLVGADLPHYWRFDEVKESLSAASGGSYSTVIHFAENFWGSAFLNLPEIREIKQILERAKKGLAVLQKNEPVIAALIQKIYHSEGVHRVIALMECLLAFADTKKVKTLSSTGYSNTFIISEDDRMNRIYKFVLNNFTRKIPLEEAAALINLEPNSFCRYFKSKTGKTFSGLLQEIRVGYACKLLIENSMNLKQICFESGFNNFSCFHQDFKRITGKTPKTYQSQYLL